MIFSFTFLLNFDKIELNDLFIKLSETFVGTKFCPTDIEIKNIIPINKTVFFTQLPQLFL